MKTYKNLSGHSDVKAFQIYADAIKIKFSDDTVYLYTFENTGQETVEIMKKLASEHSGLGIFINKNTGRDHAEKLSETP